VISVEMMVSSLVTLWSFLPSLRLSKCFMPLAVSMIQSSIWIGGFWWAQKSSIAYIWFSTVCFPVLTSVIAQIHNQSFFLFFGGVP